MNTFIKTYGAERFETIKVKTKDGRETELYFPGRYYGDEKGRTDLRANTIANRFDGSKRKTRNTLLYENKPDEMLMELMKYLTDQGIVPLKIEKLEPTLEDLFIETVGGMN